jgi:hypothetical protein
MVTSENQTIFRNSEISKSLLGMNCVSVLLLLLALFVSACGMFDGDQKTPEGYVRYCVKQLDRKALYADRPEWKAIKDSILAEAKSMTTMDQAHDAVIRAAAVAGGKHSTLLPPVEDTASYVEIAPEVKLLEGDILHVVLPAHSGVKVTDSLYIHSVLGFLQEHIGARGVILDLRGNSGGNMYPMIAAVSPLLPDGVVIKFKSRDRTTPITLDYVMNQVGLSSEKVKKFSGNTPIAILTDDWTGSSGEATLLCFRGLSNVRTYGIPTAGYASANITVPLVDGYKLLITMSCDMARTGEIFCDDPIQPDVNTQFPLEEAVKWIKSTVQT